MPRATPSKLPASPDELITGADDKHLDFRVSLLREDGARVVAVHRRHDT